MTKTEREMTNSGYYPYAEYDSRREARATANEIEASSSTGCATWVRKSSGGWTLWIETNEQHDKRCLAV